MKFPPIHTQTPQIEALLRELDILKTAFELVAPEPKTLTYLRRKSILKSSLFSARIEGNPLRMEDVTSTNITSPSNVHKREVANIVRAITFLESSPAKPFNKQWLRVVHRLVMDGISDSAGLFRSQESAIFNQAGIAVYLTPAPASIQKLLDQLFDYIRNATDHFPVRAALTHVWFEKIHPFEDGNGRVGRLLSYALLKQGEYDFGGIVPMEEYLEAHRQEYYENVGRDTQNVTQFVEFFLTALAAQAKTSLEELKQPIPQHRTELLPRRAEIVDIIRDHHMVSFDFLVRRFRAVTKSTLHYDVKQLMKSGYIKKLGSTRGAVYIPNQ